MVRCPPPGPARVPATSGACWSATGHGAGAGLRPSTADRRGGRSPALSPRGFGCLEYVVYGTIAAGRVAAVGLLLFARRFGLDLWFSLLAIALIVAPLMLADGGALGGTAFLGPGLAAWISEPTQPDPD
jgi:hypothetical protein